MPSHRLLFALSLSVLLHMAAFGAGNLLCRTQEKPSATRPIPIEARLSISETAQRIDSLLKDTLSTAEMPPTPAETPAAPDRKPGLLKLKAKAAAERKLAEHVYYPEAAISAGLEGDVRLLITLDNDGVVRDVQIAAGSGHAILDQAAMRAAWAMHSLPGIDEREIMLPVTFHLQP